MRSAQLFLSTAASACCPNLKPALASDLRTQPLSRALYSPYLVHMKTASWVLGREALHGPSLWLLGGAHGLSIVLRSFWVV